MKITPLEIRQKTFEKAFRGLDKDEVQAFLLTLSQQWEKLQDENKDLKMKLEATNREVQKMREVESSLYKTLKTAEDTSNSMVEQASKAADLQVREAQLKADQLLEAARQKARSVVETAYQQADKTIAEMQSEVKTLEQDYLRLEDYLEGMVRDLQNMAADALDKVEKTKSKPKAAIGSILSRAAQAKAQRPNQDNDTFMNTLATPMVVTAAPGALPASVFTDQPLAQQIGGGGSRESIPSTPGTFPEPHMPNPTPDVHPRTPEIVPPTPHVPSTPSPKPEIEEPKPSTIPSPTPPPIEEPKPEREHPLPEKPEVQPPGTKVAEPAPALAVSGGSFFDDIA